MAGAEFSPKLRNDTETARMVAALGNLEIRGAGLCRQQTWRVFVVKIVGKRCDCAIPRLAREPPIGSPGIALGTRMHVHGTLAARDQAWLPRTGLLTEYGKKRIRRLLNWRRRIDTRGGQNRL